MNAAFLQGDPIEHEVYLKPSSDVCSDETVWCLRMCIYGLNDATRSWHERVTETLLSFGAIIGSYDNVQFVHDDNGELFGMLVNHVDDFAFCGNSRFQAEVIETLKSIFKVGLYAND